jgi:hypothetical protein
MDRYPKDVAIHYIKTNRWISGIGEEAVPLIAPAICNAIPHGDGEGESARSRSVARILSWTVRHRPLIPRILTVGPHGSA